MTIEGILEIPDSRHEAWVIGHRGFDLDGDGAAVGRVEQINLPTVAVAEEIKIRGTARVEAGFQGLGDDQIFKETADQGIPLYLIGCFDAEEPSRQPGVGEIKLFGFSKLA